MVLTKPWGGCYVATVKPFRVALVEPVAYLKSQLRRLFRGESFYEDEWLLTNPARSVFAAVKLKLSESLARHNLYQAVRSGKTGQLSA